MATLPTKMIFSVLTTIHAPNSCVQELQRQMKDIDATTIVVGDRKGPLEYPLAGVDFYSLDRQSEMEFKLSSSLPKNHYTRKNLGYLVAVAAGAECIYETDDDTMPSGGWKTRTIHTPAINGPNDRWHNVFRNFYAGQIWPRGFPLDEINRQLTEPTSAKVSREVYAPIQQGMIDLSPDVDAIWRLVFGKEVFFETGPSVCLSPGTWCPFNSQNTWWWPEVFPLLYLPSHCEFRATDIWRGFVAQRCLWALGHGLVFHGPDTIQHRNVHNLMTDFRDEVRGYLENQNITAWLADEVLQSGVDAVGDNLYRCYEVLVSNGIFPATELALVSDWISDLDRCRVKPPLVLPFPQQADQPIKKAA